MIGWLARAWASGSVCPALRTAALVAVELTIRNPNFCDGCGTQRCNPGPDPAEMDDLCHRGAISTDRSSVGVAE